MGPGLYGKENIRKGMDTMRTQCRKFKSRYGARNRFQEPSLELSSQLLYLWMDAMARELSARENTCNGMDSGYHLDLEIFFRGIFLWKNGCNGPGDYPQQKTLVSEWIVDTIWTWKYSLEGFFFERIDAMGPGLSATESTCKGWTWNYFLEGFSCERMDAMGQGLSATENTCKGWIWNYSLEGFSCERMDAMGPGFSARENASYKIPAQDFPDVQSPNL